MWRRAGKCLSFDLHSYLLNIANMPKITKTCKECESEFETRQTEINRGNGEFCSHSCSAKYGNRNRDKIKKESSECGETFLTKAKHAKYCSKLCKNKTNTGSNKYRYHLNEKIDQLVGTGECFNCGWDVTTCDVAHIIDRSDGGTEGLDNLTVLCPNCHRAADNTKELDITSVPTVADRYRTISSSTDQDA